MLSPQAGASMDGEIPRPLVEDDDKDDLVVEEQAEIVSIVTRVTSSAGKDADAVYDRWKAILYKYQEQSQLLDALLEGIVVPLSTLLRQHATNGQEVTGQSLAQCMGICRLLNVLVAVRGYKTVVKFFPHEAQDLERVLSVLVSIKAMSKTVKTAEQGIALWESQSILLLWLSMLILVPFDLSTIDSTAVNAADIKAQRYTQIVSNLLALCQEYLYQPGSVREMAALLLGRLLTRPDMGAALEDFLSWTEVALRTVDALSAPFLMAGVLHSLCFTFKLGQRVRLLSHTPKVWSLLLGPLVLGSSEVPNSSVARKLGTKLLQRLALTFLEPRLAPWRYTRAGGQQLDVTLGSGLAGATPGPTVAVTTEGEEEEEEYEIVEEMEEVVERLLGALRDKDTVVRWSGAKGIGRVTGCLPQELADEIVAQVLDLFRPTESDAAWHGGCLALAELARRGLLLPPRLPAVTDIIQRALRYDVRRGPHSIGAHVRDAAAYVCWACSRAYEPDVLQDSVHALASSLLVVACYDREVNCRRAAAAAFQEAVGRLGNFPHGMDIIAIADYFSVGNISQAYLKVAPFIGSFDDYRDSLAEHLVKVKLAHWEKQLRELAARGCAALVPGNVEYFATQAMDYLLPLCLDAVLEVRHGAVVGVAELLPALQEAGAVLSAERQAQVAGLVPAIDKARLYRGKGGEVMREAVGHLISAISRVQLPLSKVQHSKVHEALDENLRHPQAYIQEAAVDALKHYSGAYFSGSEEAAAFRSKQLQGYLTRLHDPNVAVRRGFAAALGALPAELLGPQAEETIDALIDGMQPEEDVDDRDVQARVNCTRALGAVCRTLMTPAATPGAAQPPLATGKAVELLHNKVLPSLHEALKDYTIDNRGDVGSWVREAAMQGLVDLMQLLAQLQPHVTDNRLQGALSGAVAAVLKQAVERIARMRDAALLHLRALLSSPQLAALMPAASTISTCVPKDMAELAGVASTDSVTQLTQLLPVPEYTEQLLEGVVASVGGVDASLAKAVSAALVEVVNNPASSTLSSLGDAPELAKEALLASVALQLLRVWMRHAKSARMAGPLLRSGSLLVSKTQLLTATVSAEVAAAALAVAKPATAVAAAVTAGAGESAASGGSAVPLPDVLVEVVRAETRQCTDVARLLDAATLLCHLVPCANPCHCSAVQGLLVLLVSRYPKVRRHTAEQLYLQMLAMEPEQLPGSSAHSGTAEQGDGAAPAAPVSAEDLEQVQELLLTTCWDGDLDAAKSARDSLAALLRVPLPVMKAAAPGAAGAGKAVRDENASYAALVMDFHRGFGM